MKRTFRKATLILIGPHHPVLAPRSPPCPPYTTFPFRHCYINIVISPPPLHHLFLLPVLKILDFDTSYTRLEFCLATA